MRVQACLLGGFRFWVLSFWMLSLGSLSLGCSRSHELASDWAADAQLDSFVDARPDAAHDAQVEASVDAAVDAAIEPLHQCAAYEMEYASADEVVRRLNGLLRGTIDGDVLPASALAEVPMQTREQWAARVAFAFSTFERTAAYYFFMRDWMAELGQSIAVRESVGFVTGDIYQRANTGTLSLLQLLTQEAPSNEYFPSNPRGLFAQSWFHFQNRTGLTRGAWLMKNLFCEAVPVGIAAPSVGESRRETYALENPACSSCHQRLLDFGRSLDNYSCISGGRCFDSPNDPFDPLMTPVFTAGSLYGDAYNNSLEFFTLAATRQFDRIADCTHAPMIDGIAKRVGFQWIPQERAEMLSETESEPLITNRLLRIASSCSVLAR